MSPLSLLRDTLLEQTASISPDDALSVMFGRWLGIKTPGDPGMLVETAAKRRDGTRSYRDVAVLGFGVDVKLGHEDTFADGISWLAGRQFFRSGSTPTLEADSLGMLGVAAGIRATGADAKWMKKLLRQVAALTTDEWHAELVGAALAILGEETAIPDELAVALVSRGLREMPQKPDLNRLYELTDRGPGWSIVALAVLRQLASVELEGRKVTIPDSIPVPTREKALHDLICELFVDGPAGLRRHSDLYFGSKFVAQLPAGNVGLAELASAVQNVVRQHGLFSDLFDSLVVERSTQLEAIAAVAKRFSVELVPGHRTPIGEGQQSASSPSSLPKAERSTSRFDTEDRRGRAKSLQSRVTIGILTALPKEFAAVQTMLEQPVSWTAPGRGGGRRYKLGEVPSMEGGSHVVAVALLPDMGNNSAAARATQLLQHFPDVTHLLMCGIAGGVPRPSEPEHDVRLGDIVVSDRNGVVQYDLVKERPDGSKEHRHPPRPPGAALLDAVRHLDADALLGEEPWVEFLQRGERIKHAARPDDSLDARGEPITYPPSPERDACRPRIFTGTVAAANSLLKNREHRDYLRDRFGVKAIEMEGSGIADATWLSDRAGYLVIRGICDYCDEHKGDLWQGYAAVAAAAYARALLASIASIG